MKRSLYNTYRAQRFDEIVGQQELVENIQSQSKLDAFFHAYLLVGWYGSGKTTIARLIAMAANCEHKDVNGNPCGECPVCRSIRNGTCGDVTEIDGATNTGAENIRSLRESLPYAPLTIRKKIVIIDEVHMLSTAAFNALLKIVEEAPEHVIFIFATTEEEKVLSTIKSRCFTYTFGKIPARLIAEHVKKVAESEKIDITEGAASIIARSSDGAMRNALKLLEQVGGTGRQITEEMVTSVVGGSDNTRVVDLLIALLHSDRMQAMEITSAFSEAGKNLSVLCSQLLLAVNDVIRYRCGKDVCASDGYIEKLSLVTQPLEVLFDIMPAIQDMKQTVRDDSSEPVFLAKLFGAMKGMEGLNGECKECGSKPQAVLSSETKDGQSITVIPERDAEPKEKVPDAIQESEEVKTAGTVIEFEEEFNDPFVMLDDDRAAGGENGIPFSIYEEERGISVPEEMAISKEATDDLPLCFSPCFVISDNCRKALDTIRAMAAEYRAALIMLRNGITDVSYSDDGMTLSCKDSATVSTLKVFVDRFDATEFIQLQKAA